VAPRKSLKSLRTPNPSFRGIVCFQWLNAGFVSPVSCIVCFQWLGSIFLFTAFAARASRLGAETEVAPYL
jgi:hypothetical protein